MVQLFYFQFFPTHHPQPAPQPAPLEKDMGDKSLFEKGKDAIYSTASTVADTAMHPMQKAKETFGGQNQNNADRAPLEKDKNLTNLAFHMEDA